MLASQQTFRIASKSISFLALTALVLTALAMILGDSLVLPWYGIPTYVRTPLFLEYFRIGDESFGIIADQVLVWQHFSTGDYAYLYWTDYLLFGALILALISISVTLTYLGRSLYLFCTGLMLLVLMQLNLPELGFLPEYISYISLVLFAGITYFFQSVKTNASLALRTLSITGIYLLLALTVGWAAPIINPVSATIAFGLFAPLLLVALTMLFIGGDTIGLLFSIATKNNPNGKNGLIHFSSIGLIYILLLVLLFLEKTGQINLELWVINPYIIFMIGLFCGHLSLKSKLEVSDTALPGALIMKWLYPSMALLSLCMISYAELTANDSLAESIEMSILATQLAGAVVFFIYALINFTPQLLSNEKVTNFYAGFRAPLLTARALQLIFIVAVFFYLDSRPYYQARAGRYISLGALAENVGSDLLSSQYYKQAIFYDFYSMKSNYSLGKIAKKERNEADLLKYFKNATIRDHQEKATIALANYYSEQNQLFAKLLTLKEAKHVNEQLTNNLGIAHYEFDQYDSSLLAFERSIDLGSLEETATNYLALSYYVAGIEPTADSNPESIKSKINLQAIVNRNGLGSEFKLPLSPDSILVQDDLFYLYNHALNRHQRDTSIRASLQYYLAHPRNTGQKDFLLVGKAVQAYEAGLVNSAFESMAELIVIDSRNSARHAFTLGIWAAHQGAYLLAEEYLDMAIAGDYRKADAERLKIIIREGKVPQPERTRLQLPDRALTGTELESLKQRINENAFDTMLTLQAIQRLKTEGASITELYELLRQSITINPYDLPLAELFAMQAIEAGLTNFGRTALLSLKDKVEEEKLNEALERFEAHLESWREQLDEF